MVDDELEWAWVAGIIEGEGCVAHYEKFRQTYLAVEMKDLDILERLQRITNLGNIRKKSARGNSKETYLWSVQNKPGVKLICERILPYMGERRTAKMKEVLSKC